jgi:hypothetical protein
LTREKEKNGSKLQKKEKKKKNIEILNSAGLCPFRRSMLCLRFGYAFIASAALDSSLLVEFLTEGIAYMYIWSHFSFVTLLVNTYFHRLIKFGFGFLIGNTRE